MTPRKLLTVSLLSFSLLFVALLVVQGGALTDPQLRGVAVAALLSATLTVLVARAKTFSAAARWYIAGLAVAVIGAAAVAVTRAHFGDVVGLIFCLVGALVCAAQCVARLRAPAKDDAVITPKSVEALMTIAHRIRLDASQLFAELPNASETAEPHLIERLRQLRTELAHAEAWARRMRLPESHSARRSLSALRRRLHA